jgi:hypothetical protein
MFIPWRGSGRFGAFGRRNGAARFAPAPAALSRNAPSMHDVDPGRAGMPWAIDRGPPARRG